MQRGREDFRLTLARLSFKFGRDTCVSCSLIVNLDIARTLTTLGHPLWARERQSRRSSRV